MKTHLHKKLSIHIMWMGCDQYTYDHQTECGYARDKVTTDKDKVTCKLCLRKMAKQTEG